MYIENETIPAALGPLTNWERVAFAARCARKVFPLFETYWPKATFERLTPVLKALTLAEQSAAESHVALGLEAAITGAICTAGAALFPIYQMATDEPLPADPEACRIAAAVAKAAEWAAKAAQGGQSDSAITAMQAYQAALDAAQTAKAEEIVNRLQGDLASLARPAQNKKNRRVNQRRASRKSSKVACYLGPYDMGRNVGISILDVSESGVRLLVKTAFEQGQEVTLVLEGPAYRGATKVTGRVAWCEAAASGTFCVGVQLSKRLSYGDLQNLS